MTKRDRRLVELENRICNSENEQCECEQLQNCTNNGYCINGGCFCWEGYWGDRCERLICPNNCSIKGEEQLKYEYDMNYKYELDEITLTEYNVMRNKINKLFKMMVRGVCDYDQERCECYLGYRSDDCSIQVDCPSNCTSILHGRC